MDFLNILSVIHEWLILVLFIMLLLPVSYKYTRCKINLVIDLAERYETLKFSNSVMLFCIYLTLLSKQRQKKCQNVACEISARDYLIR